MYYMSDMLTKLFIDKPFMPNGAEVEQTFRELSTFAEYWDFIEVLLLDSIYDAEENILKNILSYQRSENGTLEIFGENIFLGPPRLRQLKVKNGSCQVHKLFQRNFRDCFGPFSLVDIDHKSFGLRNGTA